MERCLLFTLILAIVGVLLVITGISMQFITNWQVKSKVADVSISFSVYSVHFFESQTRIACVHCVNTTQSSALSAVMHCIYRVLQYVDSLVPICECDHLFIQNLVLQEGSASFENWLNPPVPVYMQFWLWNVTNANDVILGTQKAKLVQMGPYTYRFGELCNIKLKIF